MIKQSSIAKITRPALADIYPRPRMFRILDAGRKRPVTWVSGPAGSGKTTLVASWIEGRKLPCLWYQIDEGDADLATFFYYLGLAGKKAAPRHRKPLPMLTPEYLLDVPTFSKRYFENLCSRVQTPFILVFDNYQLIPGSSLFHTILQAGLSSIPHGIHVVIIGRTEPPTAFTGMLAGNALNTVGWESLRLTPEESRGIAHLLSTGPQYKNIISWMHEKTDGWAAGLILFIKAFGREAVEPQTLPSMPPEKIFDFFANELFQKIDEEMRDFLMKTSILPKMEPSTAEQLTGNRNAARILSELNRRNYFTARRRLEGDTYEYHPLFREFLMERARLSFSQMEIRSIQQQAAVLLMQTGQVEDALELYRLSDDWDNFTRLLLAQAQSLVSQGRHRSLESWLKAIPMDDLDREPWLLYWLGECRVLCDLGDARRYAEKALGLFRKQHDAKGVFLAWASAIDALVQEMGDIKRLDHWVAFAFELMNEYAFPSREVEDLMTARIFIAMPWNPADPVFVEWRKRAMELIERDGDPNIRLMTSFYLLAHFIWIGEPTTAKMILDVIRRMGKMYEKFSPLLYCMGRMCEGWFVLLDGDPRQAYSILQDGLAKGNASGVYIWYRNTLEIAASANLCMDNLSEAGQLLEQMAVGLETSRLFDRFYYYHDSAWRFMMMGDISKAAAYQEQANELAAKTGFPINASDSHFSMAIISNAQGNHKKAREHSAALHKVSFRMGSALVKYKALLVDALIAFGAGNENEGLRQLRDALVLGKERGFIFFRWWLPEMMTRLCMKALEAGIETDYVKNLIRTCNLVPDDPPLHLENWPWPLKIRALGEFRVLRDDKPLRYSRKAPKKPLELLRVIIALSGKNLSEERLTDLIWPDAEGDSGRRSLNVTLVRLRELLGVRDALQVNEGMISLNDRIVWTDVWAFERLIRAAEAESVSPSHYFLEKAIAIYHGHFLAEESGSWAISPRERLRELLFHAIESLGRYWEQNREWQKAIEVYRKGIQADDLIEKCYIRLMSCLLKTGSHAEALSVYRRLKKTLDGYSVEPSAEARDLHELIVSGNKRP